MTIVERINKLAQLITTNEYGPDSPIVQLLEIVNAQDDQIYDLKEEIKELRSQVSKAEIDIKWVTDNTSI